MAEDLAVLAVDAGGIDIFDISQPAAPVRLSHLSFPAAGGASDRLFVLAVHASNAFLSGTASGVHQVDFSDPRAPFRPTLWEAPPLVGGDVLVTDKAVYATGDGRLWVWIRPPSTFRQVPSAILPLDLTEQMRLVDDHLLVAGPLGVLAVDILDPRTPSASPPRYARGSVPEGAANPAGPAPASEVCRKRVRRSPPNGSRLDRN